MCKYVTIKKTYKFWHRFLKGELIKTQIIGGGDLRFKGEAEQFSWSQEFRV